MEGGGLGSKLRPPTSSFQSEHLSVFLCGLVMQ